MKPVQSTLQQICRNAPDAATQVVSAYPKKSCCDTLNKSDAIHHYEQHPRVRDHAHDIHDRLDGWQRRMERLFAAQRY